MRFLILVALVGVLFCCGSTKMEAADAADLALDTVTDIAQPSYQMVKNICSARQWSITRDSERTISQKEAAVAKIRSRCHSIYDIFEKIIEKQKEARELVAASRRGTVDALEALGKVKEIRKLIDEANERLSKLEE